MKCSQFLGKNFPCGLYVWVILKFQHFVLWSSLEWGNVVTVCNTVKCYVMCQNANCLDHAVSVWVGNLVVPLLGLIKKEERSVVLLVATSCGRYWWSLQFMCSVWGRCCFTQSVYERTELFKKVQTCVTDTEYTALSFIVSVQTDPELQEPQIWKTERGLLI